MSLLPDLFIIYLWAIFDHSFIDAGWVYTRLFVPPANYSAYRSSGMQENSGWIIFINFCFCLLLDYCIFLVQSVCSMMVFFLLCF